ncbi:hypothetical protein RND71_021648 [Anisodus tanguticus]|uniref:Uncharacterized protein n=1 Tax=Anisodus tanguticus TaxID=243964 RepID=A0AAE1RY74_9SOLA|nr:hypothetical protein RND71_021648 [Anisodus tanguticus]
MDEHTIKSIRVEKHLIRVGSLIRVRSTRFELNSRFWYFGVYILLLVICNLERNRFGLKTSDSGRVGVKAHFDNIQRIADSTTLPHVMRCFKQSDSRRIGPRTLDREVDGQTQNFKYADGFITFHALKFDIE